MDFTNPDTIATLISVTSVPIAASLFALMWRLVSPVARLTSRLSRDSAIYNNLPEGEDKERFAEHINRATRKLTAYRDDHLANSAIRVTTFLMIVLGVPFASYSINRVREEPDMTPWGLLLLLAINGVIFIGGIYLIEFIMKVRQLFREEREAERKAIDAGG
jgi:hypothetical protein